MLGGPELTIILVIVLVLFGGSQLPKLARNLGRAQKEFKDGLADPDKDGASDGDGDSSSGTPGDSGSVNPPS